MTDCSACLLRQRAPPPPPAPCSLGDETDHLAKYHLLPAELLQQGSSERPLSLVGAGLAGKALALCAPAISPSCVALLPLIATLLPIPSPKTKGLTQHHFVLLYPSKLQFVNRTSKAVVQVRAAGAAPPTRTPAGCWLPPSGAGAAAEALTLRPPWPQELPLERFAAPMRGAAAMPLGLCRDQLAGHIYVLAGAPGLHRADWQLAGGAGGAVQRCGLGPALAARAGSEHPAPAAAPHSPPVRAQGTMRWRWTPARRTGTCGR